MEKKKKVLIGAGATLGTIAVCAPFIYKKLKNRKAKLESETKKDSKSKKATKGE